MTIIIFVFFFVFIRSQIKINNILRNYIFNGFFPLTFFTVALKVCVETKHLFQVYVSVLVNFI